jgi:hypothetical protein
VEKRQGAPLENAPASEPARSQRQKNERVELQQRAAPDPEGGLPG